MVVAGWPPTDIPAAWGSSGRCTQRATRDKNVFPGNNCFYTIDNLGNGSFAIKQSIRKEN
jgi:hypothetical protein